MNDPGTPRTVETIEGASPTGGALSRSLFWCSSVLNAVGSVWIFVLMILINCDAFGRTFLNHPIEGVIELVEMSIVAIVFLQLSDATRRGRLTRSDGLFSRILLRKPAIGRTMGALFDLLGILFMAIIIYGTLPLLTEAVDESLYFGTEGVFTAPRWPVYFVIILGGFITLMQFATFTHRYICGGYQLPEQSS